MPRPIGIALSIIAVVGAVLVWRHAFDDDEFQHLHIAWLLGRGEVPHRDFFEHHMLAAHWLLAPLLALPGGIWQLFLARVGSLVCSLAALALLARLGRRLGHSAPVVAALVLLLGLCPFWMLKTIEVRPAAPAMLAYAWALYLLLAPDPHDRPVRRSIVLGIAVGVLVLCSLKFAVIACGLLLAAAIQLGPAGALRAGASAAACAIPYLLWLWLAGALPGFIAETLVMNLHWRRSFSPSSYASVLWQQSSTLIAAGLLGALCAPLLGERRRGAVLLVLTLAALLQIALVPVPFRQSFLPLLPLLALGAMTLLTRVVARGDTVGEDPAAEGARRPRLLAAGLLLLAAVAASVQALGEAAATGNAQDRAVLARVDAVAGSRERPVFDGRGLAFYRPHVGRYGCMHAGILLMLYQDRYARDTIAALRDAGLPPVIDDYRVAQMPELLLRFLAEHYHPLPGTPILLPGIAVDRSGLRRGVTIRLPTAGHYRVRWSGGELQLDGARVEAGSVLDLEAGPHRLQSSDFIRGLELVLERYR